MIRSLVRLNIFDQLAKRPPVSEVQSIVDEIMTLSLLELIDLSKQLSDTSFPSQLGLAQNRSVFPNPKHLFAGVDAHNPIRFK